MIHLLEPSAGDALAAWLAQRGQPAYRARQVRKWLFAGRARSLDDMTDLPRGLRDELAQDFRIWTTEIVERRQAHDGAEKLLVGLADGQTIECVLIREGDRRTVCISSQVGCAMGCVFCASGLDGVVRNLTTGEIVEQMLLLDRLLPEGERLTNVVMMGMGEPLANLNNVLAALGIASSAEGLGISARRITVSTVGLPAAIDRLAAENHPYHLAVSLHAPDDVLRSELVPVNAGTGIMPILEAADRYFEATGRRLTFEYVLLGGRNDRPEHARRLVQLIAHRNALLNLIPYNPVEGLPYQTPAAEDQRRFIDILTRGGVNVQVRVRKGDAIDAACGQLRRVRTTAAGPA